ncbi:MAG: hypothetical protein QHH12_02645 [Candidatus Bathyarchaeota archaeon]|jgi:hypothetical protein|nr:hypothetical protein [Candidatus Bathyarchaeota archaeon]
MSEFNMEFLPFGRFTGKLTGMPYPEGLPGSFQLLGRLSLIYLLNYWKLAEFFHINLDGT